MDAAGDSAVAKSGCSPLGPETRDAFIHCLEALSRALAAANSGVPRHIQEQLGLTIVGREEELFHHLQTLVVRNEHPPLEVSLPGVDSAWQSLFQFLSRPEIRLEHFVRLMVLFSVIRQASPDDAAYILDWKFGPLLNRYRQSHPFDLHELGTAFQTVGLDDSLLGRQQLFGHDKSKLGWSSEALWAYWAQHLDMLDEALQPGDDYSVKSRRASALSIVARFPEPPPQFLDRLWTFAFGASEDRLPAQTALSSKPEILKHLFATIASDDPTLRAIAAEWLGRLGKAGAIEPLMAAVRAERNLESKASMLIALELLGAPLESLLDREALFAEAVAELPVGIPTELEWFPLSALPQVHWSDNYERVPSEILQWLLVESFKLKNPEPNPLLRGYCGGLVKSEREALGRFVLEAWMAQEAYTRKGPIALTCKGVVAVAAACCGPDAVAAAGRYLAEWPRERPGQCRALVQMLAWIDHPAAVQLLLAISCRFKPATIQTEARRLSEALAKRKGWTLEQMADLAIPCAGLDQRGELHLSFGARGFSVRLNEKLQLIIADDSGKKLKALPPQRAADDKSRVQESKQRYSAAKKELKFILQIQSERLYEAMCTQRTWNSEDWETRLNRHPVMRHLCQRLVWSANSSGPPPVPFRPLDDGSLTDANDKPLQLSPGVCISIAHGSIMSLDSIHAWQQHLADYEIEPLFPQFGHSAITLSAEQEEQASLNDFKGHMINAFTLRGKAGKFGYSRGAAGDGGWFCEYTKNFTSLGITAVIGFTGNALPEQNREVALTKLYFRDKGEAGRMIFGGPARMPLSEIPPILLNECWNHMRQIAGAGTGFDAEWEQKTQP